MMYFNAHCCPYIVLTILLAKKNPQIWQLNAENRDLRGLCSEDMIKI